MGKINMHMTFLLEILKGREYFEDLGIHGKRDYIELKEGEGVD
jgi:hypothetical protein